MLARSASLIAFLALVSCSSAASMDVGCGTARIGPAGGAVVAANGATLVVPPGALSVDTEVSLCALSGFAPHRDQISDLVVARPPALALAAAASFTIPTASEIVSDGRVEIGTSVEDAAPLVLTDLRLSASSVSFSADHFGYMRVLGRVPPSVDAGPDSDIDADRDAARGDAGPTPLAPVVVGIDLDPADYSCLGMRVVEPRGDAVAVDVQVVDWQDRSFRASYQFRAVLSPPNPDDGSFDCTGVPDCVFATSDATGHATFMVPSGPVWIDVVSLDPTLTMFPDDRHTPTRQVHLPLEVPAAGGAVELEAVSARTQQTVSGFGTHFGQLTMGHVRDCMGQLVQRARLRVFDPRTGAEMVLPELFTYGTTGVPTGGGDRTGADGSFLIDNRSGTALRIEAWGQLVLDGPEVMLACELREVMSQTLVVGDLLPAAMSRPVSCSE
jgi:hypothetical protein